MDPYTLANLAGHSDFATTRRYVHPGTETVLDAMERAQKAKEWAQIEHNGSERIVSDSPENSAWRARRDSNPRPIGSKPIALSC
jgi:hypothetical protein